MFDTLVTATTATSGAGAVQAWARVEAAACARRLTAMVTLLDQAYAASDSTDRDQWCIDNWAAVCAHLGATTRLTPGATSGLLLIATALRDRFPKVAALFTQGLIDYRMVRTIIHRALNVQDPETLHHLDTTLAHALRTWAPMSHDKTEKTIDALIEHLDPDAVHRTQTRARGRSVQITVEDSGMADLFGTLFAHDATALDTRLNALTDTVCPHDPRTRDQRRADALGALAHGADRLTCLCDTQDCPAATNAPSTGVIIHLIAHHDTLTAGDDPSGDGGAGDDDDNGDGDGGGEPDDGGDEPDDNGDGFGGDEPDDTGDDGGGDEPDDTGDDDGGDEPDDRGRDDPRDPESDSTANEPDTADQTTTQDPDGPDTPDGNGRDDPRVPESDSTASEPGPEVPDADTAPPTTDRVTHPDADYLAQCQPDGTADTPETNPTPPDPPAPDPTPADRVTAECAGLDGTAPPTYPRPLTEMTLTELYTACDQRPRHRATIRPAALIDGRLIPGAIARRAALHATIETIVHPGQAPPEPRHRPSKKLADFIRCRDQTCRYPGCRVPATHCDLDHTIPWPQGPTHATNLKALCRHHHLLKTFWSNHPGFKDRQSPNGDVIWTTPDGREHTTTPGSRQLFPELCTPTAPVLTTGPPPPAHTPGLTMPRRKTTRAKDRAQRINHQRQLNRTTTQLDTTRTRTTAKTAHTTQRTNPNDEPPF